MLEFVGNSISCHVLGLTSFPLFNALGIPFITADRVPGVFEVNNTDIFPNLEPLHMV